MTVSSINTLEFIKRPIPIITFKITSILEHLTIVGIDNSIIYHAISV